MFDLLIIVVQIISSMWFYAFAVMVISIKQISNSCISIIQQKSTPTIYKCYQMTNKKVHLLFINVTK
jgi:hypothetical protein